MSIRVRKFCFTLNNYTEEELTQLHMCFEDKGWSYIIGKEIGASGTRHLQGYCEAKNAIRFETIKKIMPRAHIEKAKGNRRQNYKYCSKDGDYKSNLDMNLQLGYDMKDYLEHLKERHSLWYEWVVVWRMYEEYNKGILTQIDEKRYRDHCIKFNELCRGCKVCEVEISDLVVKRIEEESSEIDDL